MSPLIDFFFRVWFFRFLSNIFDSFILTIEGLSEEFSNFKLVSFKVLVVLSLGTLLLFVISAL